MNIIYAILLASQITIQGSGNITATPDIAVLNVRITTNADTIRSSLKFNEEHVNKTIKTLKKFKNVDVCVNGYSIHTRYDNPAAVRPGNDVSFSVINDISITVHDVKQVKKIMSDIESEDNSLTVTDTVYTASESLRNSLLKKAREMAFADAKERAATYAKAADVKLGRVVSVVEDNSSVSRYGQDKSEINVKVTVVFSTP